MSLKEKNCISIHDDEGIMVSLCVVDTQTSEPYWEVGRATCGLDYDRLDLETGLKIAKDRAMKKIVDSQLEVIER